MVLLRTTLAIACAALAASVASAPAAASGQVKRPAVTWQKTDSYTPANRSAQSIRYVVIHVTEGTFWGSVEWLQNPEAHASSHYVVSRQGRIVQMVREADVAWHAGNRRINELSTGIEHEGITHHPAGFTRAQYEASARLAAYIARRSLMPITRRHFIGHSEVPSPFDPSKSGGANKHTDPGPYWNWNLYLRLVRKYAFPTPPVAVSSATLRNGQTVAGSVPWRAATRGKVARVDFYVNGKLRWRSSRAPHVFAPGRGLNTTALKNGSHTLELRAFGAGSVSSRQRLTIRVQNRPFELTTAGLRAGDRIEGVLSFRASARTAPVESIALFVNGTRVALGRSAPFAFRWDARRAKPGPHVLLVRATAKDGRRASRSFRVVVVRPGAPAAPPSPPAPPPPGGADIPAPVLLGQSLEPGQVVQGTVEWRPRMTGRVARIEYLVDGRLRHTAVQAPFAYQWDTTQETPGERVLTVRLVGPTGKVTEGSVTVLVAPS
jgi:N-acetyl-anhydromuramyl-L-alanine amidase AmpD